MQTLTLTPELVRRLRLAGIRYLAIIVAGLSAELALRGPLITAGDAEATAAAILGAPLQFRLAIVADLLMALCDAGLAVVFYLVFRTIAPGLALAAMVFRLVQGVLIAGNLMLLQAAWLVVSQESGPAAETALLLIDLHAHGYDLGLVFFGINSLMTGVLIWRSGIIARGFGLGVMVAGGVYLVGSALRFLAPDMLGLFLPAYGVTILAEGALCLRLLVQRGAQRL